MLQRDYILRLIREFTEALEELWNEKEKKETTEVQEQLQTLYRAYFNHPPTFYYEQDAEYIMNDLRQNYEEESFLGRIDMLSELMYRDALLKAPEEQNYLAGKALYLLTYLDEHSNTFSFERRRKICEIAEKVKI